jgi:hypothetical protein
MPLADEDMISRVLYVYINDKFEVRGHEIFCKLFYIVESSKGKIQRDCVTPKYRSLETKKLHSSANTM